MLPRVKGRKADVKGSTRAAPLAAITADDVHFLRFYMGPDDKQVVVEDVQNNTASIVSGPQEVGNVVIYGVDRVLLSGACRGCDRGMAQQPSNNACL